MDKMWSNWSGSLIFQPGTMEKPETEQEVQQIIKSAAENGKKVRVAGAGHSSTPLVRTEDVLISLEKMKGITGWDKEKQWVEFLPGMTVDESGHAFLDYGLNLPNTGDVDIQYLAGAIGTGTHGSGIKIQNLSGFVVGGTVISGNGEIKNWNIDDDEFNRAARVSMGMLGVFTRLKVRLEPELRLHRKEWCVHVDDCLKHLHELIYENRHFDFYWYPRNDLVKLRIANKPGEGMNEIPYGKCVKEELGWLPDILPRKRSIKFDEMEYAIAVEDGAECFRDVRARVKERWIKQVGWRVLFRTIAADDAMLSPCYKRDTVTIAVLQNNELEWENYFRDIEKVFKKYNGRPHWGKKHFLTADDLKPLYPEWQKFLEIRQQHDPKQIFINDYLKKIMGV